MKTAPDFADVPEPLRARLIRLQKLGLLDSPEFLAKVQQATVETVEAMRERLREHSRN